MLTKFDIGQKVHFWYGKSTSIRGTISRIEINKVGEIFYWVEWETEKATTMDIPEEDVFY